ncbi:: Lectin_legB [Gemmata massiliana]|uniref:: Lectin_legB n=1 Tax=Gemmata massiliana TaxID=1210884 RepID=A0A6P2D3Y8_9BACT|nr:hypothetical protein [Gemmata massiliana]VTR96028.1 : Lectin_legB [Gemmata massiliana]
MPVLNGNGVMPNKSVAWPQNQRKVWCTSATVLSAVVVIGAIWLKAVRDEKVAAQPLTTPRHAFIPARSDAIPMPHESTSSADAEAVRSDGKEKIYTTQIRPRGKLQKALRDFVATPDDSGNNIFVLRIEDAVLPENQAAHGMVFLLKPSAPLPTSSTDPGFVGSFTTSRSKDVGRPQSIEMEINAAVRELAEKDWFRPDEQIYIGIVGVSDEESAAITPIRFRKATLTACSITADNR